MVAATSQSQLPRTPITPNNSMTAGSAAAQPSTLESLKTQPTAAEQQRVSDLQEQFQQQAQKDPAGFRLALQTAFGDKASPAQIDQLLDLALAGKLPMPASIQFVEAGSLGSGALGAYDASDGGSLYLDRSLMSDPGKLQSVFNEEMGHHLDALLGGADAAGDEGAVFSLTLEQGALSERELTALKSENDHGVIQIEGRWLQVEFSQEGGECSVDSDDGGTGGAESAGGDTSGGTGGAESAGGDTSGGTGGECNVDDSPNSDTPSAGGHQNGESDTDKAGGPPGTGSPGGPPGGDNDEPLGAGGTPDEQSGGPPGTGTPGGPPGGDNDEPLGAGGTPGGDERSGGPPGTGTPGGPPGGDNDEALGAGGTPGGDEDLGPDETITEENVLTTDDDKPPTEEETKEDLDATGIMGTLLGFVDAFNDWARGDARNSGVPEEVLDVNKGVGTLLKGAGHVATAADPAIAALQEGQRARSEGADVGEQIDRAVRAGLKRADNVGVTLGVGATVGSINPVAGVAAGALAGNDYADSPADKAFDTAVDAIADEIQSPTMGVPSHQQNTAGNSLGWPAFNQTIR